MLKDFFLLCAALLAAGCSDIQWRRLAPPGIVKYEEIAGDKPPNPAIEEEIARRKERDKAQFPDLAHAPSEADRPAKRPQALIDEEISELASARDRLAAEIEADQAAVEADRDTAGDLVAERDVLTEEIDRDETAAKNERRQ